MEYGINKEVVGEDEILREMVGEDEILKAVKDEIMNRDVVNDEIIIEDEINKELISEEGIEEEQRQVSRKIIEDGMCKEMKNRTDSKVGEEVRSKRRTYSNNGGGVSRKKIKEKGELGEEEEDVQTLRQLFNKLEIKEGAHLQTGNRSKGARHKQEERVQDAQYQSPRTRRRAGWEAEKLREPEQRSDEATTNNMKDGRSTQPVDSRLSTQRPIPSYMAAGAEAAAVRAKSEQVKRRLEEEDSQETNTHITKQIKSDSEKMAHAFASLTLHAASEDTKDPSSDKKI